MYLLKRYLESVCQTQCEAIDFYVRLIKKIDEVHALNEDVISILLDTNQAIEPLLVEIFDLKF